MGKNIFLHGSAINDRREFFRNFFPKWHGFYVDSTNDQIQVVEGLQRLECLFNDISTVWTSSSGTAYCSPVDSQKLMIGEVGVNHNKRVGNL